VPGAAFLPSRPASVCAGAGSPEFIYVRFFNSLFPPSLRVVPEHARAVTRGVFHFRQKPWGRRTMLGGVEVARAWSLFSPAAWHSATKAGAPLTATLIAHRHSSACRCRFARSPKSGSRFARAECQLQRAMLSLPHSLSLPQHPGTLHSDSISIKRHISFG